jgi:hypothetical protein
LQNEDLHNLYSSTNNIRMTKLRMRCAGHIARKREMGNVYKIVDGKSVGRTALVKSRRILGIILKRFHTYRIGECRLDSYGSGQGPVAGTGQHCSEPSDPTKNEELLDRHPFKKDTIV